MASPTLNLNAGVFNIDATTTAAHVLTAAPAVNFNGGALSLAVTAAGNRTENVGALSFLSGTSTITLNTAATGTAILSSNAPFVRATGGGTLTFLTPGVVAGTNAQLLAAGQTVGPVLYASVNGNPSATYSATQGLIANAAAVAFFSNVNGADFNNPAQWDSPAPGTPAGIAPTTGSNVTIINTGVTNSGNTNVINSLTFSAGSSGLAAGSTPLNVGAGGILVSATAPATLMNAEPINFAAVEGLIDVPSGDTLIFSGTLTGSGGITTLGAGTVTLTVDNSATLTTLGFNVTGGTLSISADNQLGPVALAPTLNGGTLLLTSALTSARNFTLGTSGGTISNSAAVTLSGSLSGSGGLAKTGAGQLSLTALNTYTGPTTLSGGVLTRQYRGARRAPPVPAAKPPMPQPTWSSTAARSSTSARPPARPTISLP